MNNQSLSRNSIWRSSWRKGWLLLIMIVMLAGCWQDPLAEPSKLVKVGMLRKDAVRALSEKSWYHQECPPGQAGHDLFFFGSHKYDDAALLIVRSKPVNGVFVVYDVGSFEPYAWHAAYQDCLQRDRFED